MKKKAYNGLRVTFVPIDGTNIITTSVCEIISVQYYVVGSMSECTTEEGDGDPEEGYSYNWNAEPTND